MGVTNGRKLLDWVPGTYVRSLVHQAPTSFRTACTQKTCNIENWEGPGERGYRAPPGYGYVRDRLSSPLFETVTSYYIIEMAGRPAGHTAYVYELQV